MKTEIAQKKKKAKKKKKKKKKKKGILFSCLKREMRLFILFSFKHQESMRNVVVVVARVVVVQLGTLKRIQGTSQLGFLGSENGSGELGNRVLHTSQLLQHLSHAAGAGAKIGLLLGLEVTLQQKKTKEEKKKKGKKKKTSSPGSCKCRRRQWRQARGAQRRCSSGKEKRKKKKKKKRKKDKKGKAVLKKPEQRLANKRSTHDK